MDSTKPMHPVAKFDAAMVIGGLHHCVADLPQTLRNVVAMLKPGGIFMMLEPNSIFFLEAVRNLWYRHDPSFDAPNEHALCHDETLKLIEEFSLRDVRYFGGPAYFGVLNSMILRIPLAAKRYTSPPLMIAERRWNHLPWATMHNVFHARWNRL
jgi:SAM-dependent methyltransferase